MISLVVYNFVWAHYMERSHVQTLEVATKKGSHGNRAKTAMAEAEEI